MVACRNWMESSVFKRRRRRGSGLVCRIGHASRSPCALLRWQADLRRLARRRVERLLDGAEREYAGRPSLTPIAAKQAEKGRRDRSTKTGPAKHPLQAKGLARSKAFSFVRVGV